jgi:hypothetical protein
MKSFEETPQAKALQKRIAACDSRWQREGLISTFNLAKAHYEGHHNVADRIKRMFAELDESEQEWFLENLKERIKQVDRLAIGRPDQNPADKENQMSLEDSVLALTKAVEANTAALLLGGGKPAGAAATKTTTAAVKPAATVVKPTRTREEMSALAVKYRETIGDANGGKEKTQAIIAATGKAAKLKEVADANIDALCAALEAAITEAEAGNGGGDSDM